MSRVVYWMTASRFTPLDAPLELRLVETRTFPGGVVLLRYSRAGQEA